MTNISSSDERDFTEPTASTPQPDAAHKSERLARLLAQKSLSPAEIRWLATLPASDPLEEALMRQSGRAPEDLLGKRFDAFRASSHSISLLAEQFGWQISALALWSFYLPLAQLLDEWDYEGACNLVGLAGAPGAGKTSLVKILTPLVTILSGRDAAIAVSLDDFYLSPAERRALGYKWRAAPGTHDLVLLEKFISAVKQGGPEIAVPRYDTAAERRDAPLVLKRAPRLVIFEGWFVGALAPGYEMLSSALDHLIYLDMDIELAFESRVRREAKIRAESGDQKGMTEEQVLSFWQDVLLPGTQKWVAPLKAQADLIFKIDATHRIYSVRKA